MKMLREFARYLRCLAKELSDENAYERHLAYCGKSHSAEEWRRFSDARLGRKYRQGKCC